MSIALLWESLGCAPEPAVEWMPAPTVRWSDITPKKVNTVVQGYRLLTDRPTQGVFPTSMGVTRLALSGDGPALMADPRNEFLQWNSAFDDQMAIGDVFPVVQKNLGGAETKPAQVLRAVHALRGGIGLVYAVNELSERETEMFGVLFESATAEPLAAVHASASSTRGPEEEQGSSEENLWDVDSRALVRDQFQRYVHACVRDLILQDRPAPVEAPTGWTPVGPTLPVEWPPRPFGR